MITQDTWKLACQNMAEANAQTVETFGLMLQNIIFDPIKMPREYGENLERIVNYVASQKFREEEGLN
jgi:hypothetical protein